LARSPPLAAGDDDLAGGILVGHGAPVKNIEQLAEEHATRQHFVGRLQNHRVALSAHGFSLARACASRSRSGS
jgi:hypothetical protein